MASNRVQTGSAEAASAIGPPLSPRSNRETDLANGPIPNERAQETVRVNEEREPEETHSDLQESSRSPRTGPSDGTDEARQRHLHVLALLGQASVSGSDGTSAANASTLANAGQLHSEVVVGVPIGNFGIKKGIRRVIILSAAGAVFFIVHFMFGLLWGPESKTGGEDVAGLSASISSLLVELSIPACGYCGALYNNRQLTCCFCSCNLFVALVSAMTFVRLNLRIAEIEGQCSREINRQQRRTCEAWVNDTTDKYIMVVSTVIFVTFGFLAFWFGNSLYSKLTVEQSVQDLPSPLVGEVISLTQAARAGFGRNDETASATASNPATVTVMDFPATAPDGGTVRFPVSEAQSGSVGGVSVRSPRSGGPSPSDAAETSSQNQRSIAENQTEFPICV